MKILLFALLLLGFINLGVKGQQLKKVDTVLTVDYGKMPPVYFSNKVYWEKNYNKDNILLFEGLKYNSCFIGSFMNYWPSGRIRTKGQYALPKTGTVPKPSNPASCSFHEGEWITYNEDGEISHTVLYKNGKIEKEY